MADLGDLEKFPPEIRDEIYALVLVQAEPVALSNFGGDQKAIGMSAGRGRNAPDMDNEWARSYQAKVALVGYERRIKGIGYKYVGNKWVEVPSNVALLCVNKRVYAEATPILYGGTKFRFENVGTLHRFVDLIGENNQHLRDVGMMAGGWKFRLGFYEARYALEALAAAKNIRTFEVSHLDVCPNVGAADRKYIPGGLKVVRLCRPLLDSLAVAYKNNNLDTSILDVIKISSTGTYTTRYRPRSCGCTEKQATEVRIELERNVKRSIAEQHGLVFNA
jgi:hypothetical protein